MIRKLLIAIPCYDTMRAEFVQSLTALMERLHRDGIPFEVKIITGSWSMRRGMPWPGTR